MLPDLTAARSALLAGECRAVDLLAQARSRTTAHTYIRHFDDQAERVARHVDALLEARMPVPALAGLAVSIKDLFDVAGQPTTAGSVVLASAAPARQDAPAVARLRAAGAALTGHTNMTEFAFSGVGWNPHHGTPANAGTLAVDPSTRRIPGGSSSGAAVSVASGAAWAALGSDTGGSIRIPAALQGLVGFKNTARLTPTEGAVPLSTTLDTACAVTRSVRDAIMLHEVLAARPVKLTARPLAAWRLAVVRNTFTEGLDTIVSRAFQSALAQLRRDGAQIDEIDLPELDELSQIQATGGFSAAEAWAWHRRLLATDGARYDPRVAQRIRRGESMSAADYIDLLHARRDWIDRVEATLQAYDAILSPTVPLVAPAIDSIATDDSEFFRVNGLMLRNTSVVNMLDGCALSLPCQAPGELPVGLMVWSGALHDDTVLDVSLDIERSLSHQEQ